MLTGMMMELMDGPVGLLEVVAEAVAEVSVIGTSAVLRGHAAMMWRLDVAGQRAVAEAGAGVTADTVMLAVAGVVALLLATGMKRLMLFLGQRGMTQCIKGIKALQEPTLPMTTRTSLTTRMNVSWKGWILITLLAHLKTIPPLTVLSMAKLVIRWALSINQKVMLKLWKRLRNLMLYLQLDPGRREGMKRVSLMRMVRLQRMTPGQVQQHRMVMVTDDGEAVQGSEWHPASALATMLSL
jgi:hypothetical protein